jgi:hypothetical protein
VSAHGEQTLILHLTDEDSLDTLAREGLPVEMLPTEEMRPVYEFALDYFIKSGAIQAPSPAVMHETFGDLLEDSEIDFHTDSPEDTVEWAIDDLRSGWAYSNSQQFNKQFAIAMAEADNGDRVRLVGEAATSLVELSGSLQRKSVHMEAEDGLSDAIRRHESRSQDPGTIRGMGLGMPDVDTHLSGIHDGELAILAAYAKVGKSYSMLHAAKEEWKRGRNVLIYSLELSTAEVFDRIACMVANIPGQRWQRGECDAEELEILGDVLNDMKGWGGNLTVRMPEISMRSFPIMVREAQVYDAESLFIDQLTFVELPNPRDAQHERIGNALHDLKAQISTARRPIPCYLNHQVNREGHQASLKSGRLEMWHLANGSECERSADFVMGLYRGHDQIALDRAQLQMLASRRSALKWWELEWAPDRGVIRVSREVPIDTER